MTGEAVPKFLLAAPSERINLNIGKHPLSIPAQKDAKKLKFSIVDLAPLSDLDGSQGERNAICKCNTDIMKYFALLIILCTCILESNGQSDSSLIDLQIRKVSLVSEGRESKLTVSLECKSRSYDRLLLYGIMGVNFIFGADNLCNVNRVGGGIGVFIRDSLGHKVREKFSRAPDDDPTYAEPMTRERLLYLMEEGRKKFLTGTKVIEKGDLSQFDITIDVKKLSLKSGIYTLQLIYYAGKGLHDKLVVGDKQIEDDMYKHDAVLFQGCAVTNIISFRKM